MSPPRHRLAGQGRRREGERGRERGFALLIVLWTLVLITLLVTQLAASGRGAAQLSGNLRLAAQVEAIADGAVHEAIFHLLDRSEAGWQTDPAPRILRRDGAVASIRITDEGGRVNPSTAPPELLQALLRQIGVDTRTAQALAEAMVEWRTPYGQQGTGLARFDRYRAAGRVFGPSGGPFLALADVAAVYGMTPEIMAGLAPHLTLATEADPDPAVADPVVLAALTALAGGRPPASAPRDQALQVVSIAASVSGPGNAAFTRHAVVRLTDNAGRQDFHIVEWTAR